MALFGKRQRTAQVEAPADPVIDLRGAEPVIIFGKPAPCPDCGHAGYLDSIDPQNRVMYQHCPACFGRWSIAEDDILAANARRKGPTN
jgi:hypothetical protein